MNWGAGIRGLGGAWILASMSVWYDSALPLLAAGLIVAFSLFVPLRLGNLLLSREFVRLLLRAFARVLVVTAIAYPVGLAANSHEPTVAALGNVLMIGLLTTVGAMLLGAAKTVAAHSLPSVVTAFKSVQTRAHGWVAQATAAMRDA